jgi:3-deoxy-manno-octulosonate cytidylyltransferase (CMP-KDO synthetase)
MQCIAVVPARYSSRRFPGKLLKPIGGIPVVIQTLARVGRAKLVDSVTLATDHDAISEAVRKHDLTGSCSVMKTPTWLESGTQRVAWAAQKLVEVSDRHRTIIVNVQGDQPGIDPEHVDAVIRMASTYSGAHVTTLCTPIRSMEEFADDSVVKCVLDSNGYAMYFSRSQIPFKGYREHLEDQNAKSDCVRSANERSSRSLQGPFRHLGIYAFRADTLVNDIMPMNPCQLDSDENLEQLRWMYHGARVKVGLVPSAARSVDTPRDLQRASDELEKHDGI